jgi:hypothetical protein
LAGNVGVSKERERRKGRRERQGFNVNAVRRASVVDPFAGSGMVPVLALKQDKKLDITPLIKLAVELPEGPLKTVLLSEIDGEMDVTTFLARYPVWVRLARMKKM